MDDLELTGIRVFREIVDSGSFAAAASRLGLAPPMVSKHVARLERTLGARLLHRSSRRLSLTEAGSLFFEQGRQALELIDAAAAAVGEAAGTPRGELKISAPVWCANPAFARLLADFRVACPEVRLDMHLDGRIVDIVSEGFDLALRLTAEPSPALIARRLCDVAFRLVAAPGYLQGRSGGDGASEPGPAAPLDVILPTYVKLDRPPFSLGSGPLRWKTAMKSSDTTLSLEAVRAGMGAAFLPNWLVDDDLADGRLVAIDVPALHVGGPLFAVYASRRHMPPKLRAFIDFLAARLGGEAARPSPA